MQSRHWREMKFISSTVCDDELTHVISVKDNFCVV